MIQFTTLRNARIAYTDSERGYPNVVLLHGFLESQEIWTEFKQKLAKQCRVITLDLLGHGQSESIGYHHSMHMQAEMVHRLLDHIGLRRYYLVGHSMGGYVAAAFCKAFPQHIKGVCLFSSSLNADNAARKKVRLKAIKLLKKDKINYINEALDGFFDTETHQQHFEAIKQLKLKALEFETRGIAANIWGMMERPSLLETMSKLKLPVHFICGDKDPIISLKDVREQQAVIALSTLDVLPNCGHFGYLEQSEACLASIKKFIHSPKK